MIEASTYRAPAPATVAPMRRLVSAAMALQSTYRGAAPVAVMAVAISRAAASAWCGTRMDSTTSAACTSASSEPRSSMPTCLASWRVRALRPSRAAVTRSPCCASTPATACPMSPGLWMAMVSSFMAQTCRCLRRRTRPRHRGPAASLRAKVLPVGAAAHGAGSGQEG